MWIILLLSWLTVALALEESGPRNGPSHPPCNPDCDNLEDVRCCKPRKGRKSKNTRCPLSCLPQNPATLPQYKVIEPDTGFYPFDFGYGNRGSIAFTNFITNSPFATRILFMDCYCAGDKFFITQDLFLNQTAVSSNIFDLECNNYSENPADCYNRPDLWSQSEWIPLEPGLHNFTIQAMVSPWGQGTGFVILQAVNEYQDPLCQYQTSPQYPCNAAINEAEACCEAKQPEYPVPDKFPVPFYVGNPFFP